jgi:myosin heavy subunit
MEQSPNNNSKTALIVLAVLTAVLGVLYFRSYQTTKDQATQIEQKATELANTRSSLDSISTQLDAKIAEIKSLGGQVADLEALKVQLEQDKASLKSSNHATIASYEAKIKEYNAVLTTKDGEIVELKKQNGILTENNQTLTTQNTTLTSVSEKNKELARKVSIAAALKAQNVKVLAVNAKGKETERTRLNGKKIEKLKVVFSLAANPITKLENKTVYIRVLDAEGATLSDEAIGSGRMTQNGKELAYTTKQTFEYTNDGQTVAVTYPRGPVVYKPGKYSVELYAEGFLIGTGAFEVK